MSDLTNEQVENWRRVLSRMFGPYAFFMPVEQIELMRDRMQAWAWRENETALKDADERDEVCTCDPNHHGKTVHRDGSVECNHCHKPRPADGGKG